MSVKWLTPAYNDLNALIEWYQENSPDNLQPVVQAIWDTTQSLNIFPNRGRPGTIEKTRELLIPRVPYMFVYKVIQSDAVILRLLHQHQKWPEE